MRFLFTGCLKGNLEIGKFYWLLYFFFLSILCLVCKGARLNSLRPSDANMCQKAIIVSYNGLTPGRRQAIIWTNAGILLIGPLGTNFSEILIKIYKFSLKKMHLKTSSAK